MIRVVANLKHKFAPFVRRDLGFWA